jgi:hypothetical protein
MDLPAALQLLRLVRNGLGTPVGTVTQSVDQQAKSR